MNTYKITNITNLVGKRDPKFNSIVNIEYVDNRIRKIKLLKAGESVFLTVQSLPLSVHRLRIKNLVEIAEVSPAELQKNIEASKPKPKKKPKVVKKPVAMKETVVEEKKAEPVVEMKTTRKKTVKE